MNRKVLCLASILFFLNAVSAEESKHASGLDIEVIEIIGQFSPSKWRQIADRRRIDFYELFNEFNEIDEFKMVCRPFQNSGSQIKYMKCEPLFFKNKMYELTQRARMTTGLPNFSLMPTEQQVAFAVRETKARADEYMEELIGRHPELRKQFELYVKAYQASQIRKTMD